MSIQLQELTSEPQRPANAEGNFYSERAPGAIGPGMNERIQRLRKISYETKPSLSLKYHKFSTLTSLAELS